MLPALPGSNKTIASLGMENAEAGDHKTGRSSHLTLTSNMWFMGSCALGQRCTRLCMPTHSRSSHSCTMSTVGSLKR
jgi:hypothetical protein